MMNIFCKRVDLISNNYRINVVSVMKIATVQLVRQQLSNIMQNQASNANSIVAFIKITAHKAEIIINGD